MLNLYSPPHKGYPQELPDYWKFQDGTIRTDLRELSDAELLALEWYGPIEMPPFPGTNYFTHNYNWNPDTISFDVVEASEGEKRERVNYREFWSLLVNGTVNLETGETSGGTVYQKIKSSAKQSLEVNVSATEFISLMADARQGNEFANVEKIQEVLTEITTLVTFSDSELAELQEIFTKTGMYAVYTI